MWVSGARDAWHALLVMRRAFTMCTVHGSKYWVMAPLRPPHVRLRAAVAYHWLNLYWGVFAGGRCPVRAGVTCAEFHLDSRQL